MLIVGNPYKRHLEIKRRTQLRWFTQESVSNGVIMLPHEEVVDRDVGHLRLSSIGSKKSQPVLGGDDIVWVGGGLGQLHRIQEVEELRGGQGEDVFPHHGGLPLIAVGSGPAKFALAAVEARKVTCNTESKATLSGLLQVSYLEGGGKITLPTCASARLIEELGRPSLSVVHVPQIVRSSPRFAVHPHRRATPSTRQRAADIGRVRAQSRAALLRQDALHCAANPRKLSHGHLGAQEKTKKSNSHCL